MTEGEQAGEGRERPSGTPDHDAEPDTDPRVAPRVRAATVKLDDALVAAADDEPPTPPRRQWKTVVLDPGVAADDANDDEDDADAAPAAVRPLGRLGSDGWGLALDYAPATGVEEERLEHWLSEALPAVESMAPTEAHPDLAPVVAGAAPTVGIAELDRLAALAADAPHEESARLEAWLEQQHDAPPETAAPEPASTNDAGLPFERASTSATLTLEAWVDAWLQTGPEDVGAAPPAVPIRPPVPGVDAPVDRPEAPESEEPEREPEPLVAIEVYAAIKIRLWDDGTALVAALDEAGIDETTWREHELRQATALAEELRRGEASLATALRRAIAEARRARADEDWAHLLPLPAYARITAELEPLDTELERREVLLRHDLTLDAWDAQRAGWAKRARLERGSSKEVRRAVAKARRALGEAPPSSVG